MSEWIEKTLGEICDEVNGIIKTGPFGSQLHQSDYTERGVPVVMPKNIIDDKISTDDIAYISEETAERLTHHRMRPGDIVYGRRGDIGRQALITARENSWLCGTGCLRISLGESVLLPIYLHYYLMQSDVINWIYNQAIGATMPNLNTTILRSVPICYPPLPTQRRIAAILSAYDDLIENNTRRIQALEQAAHDLYREWFVEFRFPGHESVEMVDSGTDYGMIPHGWEVVKLEEVAEVNALSIRNGDTPAEIEYVDISSVSTGRIENTQVISFEDAPSRARRIVRHGDTIWATVRPNRRSYALILRPSENLIVSTGFAVITPSKVPYGYLYQSITTEAFAEYLTNHATGSAYPAVNSNDFKSADILAPSVAVAEEYHSIVADLYDEKAILEQKNNALREARDLLLPRLVSGQLDVSDIEVENLP